MAMNWRTCALGALLSAALWAGWWRVESPQVFADARPPAAERGTVESPPPQARAAAPTLAASQANRESMAYTVGMPTIDTPRDIGSEGYGPWIQRVLESGSAREASDAVELINACHLGHDIESELLDALPGPLPPVYIDSLRRHVQRCQTITADLASQRVRLAQRAVDGNWPGAPKLLQDAQRGDAALSPSQRVEAMLRETMARKRLEQLEAERRP